MAAAIASIVAVLGLSPILSFFLFGAKGLGDLQKSSRDLQAIVRYSTFEHSLRLLTFLRAFRFLLACVTADASLYFIIFGDKAHYVVRLTGRETRRAVPKALLDI